MPFKSITLLGSTIDYPFNCQAYVAMGDETLENLFPMYDDISKVSQVVVNYSDGTNKSYSKEKIFDANSYYMDYFYFSSKEIPVLYMDGMFIINMPSSHIEKQITSVILVEDGVAKKYNVGNSTMVMSSYAPN